MAVNISYPELKETKGLPLPSASLETLKSLRNEICSKSSNEFKLQNYQRFLRRVLSPDSPVRNLLVFHGTGTGKTCTAIQIAEEYIIRPEFQDKTVLVLANPSVQENFKNQIFNISKVYIDHGIINSKQCTGRRYLDMILRVQSEPLKWSDPVTRERINNITQSLIKEFYEFQGYIEFANSLDNNSTSDLHLKNWIHKTFDNRMIIVDEAHALKQTEEYKTKKFSNALEKIISVANNVTLILLTATPMFDDYTEILFYFRLFLLNERKETNKILKVFKGPGEFYPGMETKFREWCSEYVSFVRGDNPLTFPFRLPPPTTLIAPPATRNIEGKLILQKDRRSFITLTGSQVKGIQKEVLNSLDYKLGFAGSEQTVCVLPNNENFNKIFTLSSEEDSLYKYVKPSHFLAPSQIENHSSKFSLVTKLIDDSEGVIFVYSNLVEYGAQLFCMCLEEHGYKSALNTNLLEKTAGEVERGTRGKYALFTSGTTESERRKLLDRLRLPNNSEGKDIKIIVGSKAIAEGIDLQYVRQIHILDFWWNMSRIEQAVGRGIRTCSHALLPFEKQNCTVYIHVCKDGEKELIDEHYYRTVIEKKGIAIAKVKKIIIESAMDCDLQLELNSLPAEWRNLEVTQEMSFQKKKISMKLGDMAAPIFGDLDVKCNIKPPKKVEHERPLSAYLDVRDELFDRFLEMFARKPIWEFKEITEELKNYSEDVILYSLQSAIESGFKLKDNYGNVGKLESKGSKYAITFGDFNSLQDRTIQKQLQKTIKLSNPTAISKASNTLEQLMLKAKWDYDVKAIFPKEVLEWYIVDHKMNKKERLQHMLSLNWETPPIYAQALKTNTLRILGSKQIYRDTEQITPIGEQEDEYNEWLTKRKKLFIEKSNKIFATMQDGLIKFNVDNKADKIQRAERTKTMGGMVCSFFSEQILSMFTEWLGKPFPAFIKTKVDKCQFLALLFRYSVLKGNDIVWWTPEEWAIFNEPTNRKEILAALKS